MKKLITAVVTVAMLSLSAVSASAASEEMSMVIDTVTKLLVELGLPTDGVQDLTAKQLTEIVLIADSKEMGDGTRGQVQKILDQ